MTFPVKSYLTAQVIKHYDKPTVANFSFKQFLYPHSITDFSLIF